MALTRAWTPGAGASAAGVLGVAEIAVEWFETAAPTAVTLAAGPKMLVGDTGFVRAEEPAVPALSFVNRLENALVVAIGPAGCAVGLVGPEIDGDETGWRVIGAVRVGAEASVLCIRILIRPPLPHFARRCKLLKIRLPAIRCAPKICRPAISWHDRVTKSGFESK